MTKAIKVSGGGFALVDNKDFENLNQFKWHVTPNGYAIRQARNGEDLGGARMFISLHNAIMGSMDGYVIDHINGEKMDCRRSNLRFVTPMENSQNKSMPKNNTSGFKGVSFNKPMGKFTAQIRVNYKLIHIGSFENPEFAAEAYDGYARKYFGKFAKLNFPERKEAW